MIFRCWLLDEPEENPPRRKPKTGVSRIFRCELFDNEETRIAIKRPIPKQESSVAGGIWLLDPAGPAPIAIKKKKKKVQEQAVPVRASLVSFLPEKAVEAVHTEDAAPALRRARRGRALLLLAAAGSSPYRR